MPDLSVIIVNYNTRDDLRACLHALAAVPLDLEVIVVDNASHDASADMVRAEFPTVRLIASPVNTWFCGGNNLGLRAACADYALLLNPDTVPEPDALPRLLAYALAHPEVAGVTAQLRYPDAGVQQTGSRLPSYAYLLVQHSLLGLLMPGWRRRLAAHHTYADEGWTRTASRSVAVPPGSCVLARRDDLWLNERLWLYFPEDDLARRLGRPFVYLADAHIVHREKATTRNWRAARVYFRDLFVYTRQHHGASAALLLMALALPVMAGMWLRRRLRPNR